MLCLVSTTGRHIWPSITHLASSFGMDQTQSIMSIRISRLSKPSNVNRMADRGAAMTTTEGPRKPCT